MATIENFEDIKRWQRARELTNLIYDLTSVTPFSRDYELRNQIRRASGSIMHNIAEGFDAGSNPEFIRFLRIARRSASEVQSQLYLALDRNYIDEKSLKEAYTIAAETKKLINALITYLKKSIKPSNQQTSKRNN
jgi:four helix bundle protein